MDNLKKQQYSELQQGFRHQILFEFAANLNKISFYCLDAGAELKGFHAAK